MKINILYIHGFNSSPLSEKAELTRLYFAKHYPKANFVCPQLPSTPKQAVALLEQTINSSKHENWYLIGSSLGGFFSTYLVEQYGLSAVLINPAVKPFELLVDYLGPQENPYTKERYVVKPSHMNDLKQLDQEIITKKSYLVMVQKGDEVLDYRQAVTKYKNCQLIVQSDGDHSFVDYQAMLPQIASFFETSES